ncbi:class F sortase [Arthrobacter ruber]|uniref:class F sortase n=1 Tax=Arthrobacter ruber TaxID=1258893 RepID=UPI0012FFD79E|nr:class F sortase [Arthrobacter ruber]
MTTSTTQGYRSIGPVPLASSTGNQGTAEDTMEPENTAVPTDHHDASTPFERIVKILRFALLPLAAVALVAVMIIFIPTLGDSSQAAEDGQGQALTAPVVPTPDSTAAPDTAEATPDNTAADTPASAPSTPPAPVASPTPTPSGSGEATGASSPQGVAPTHITVAAAGIDVAVLPLIPTKDEIAAQSIVPPITDDGYWLTSYGAPGEGSTDTTYIAGHSWEGREAPFDLFSTNTDPGDTIVLDTMAGPLTYVVDDVTTYDKNTLKDSDIWDITPHRLVIISCFTEDPWGKNVVVTASPAT